MPLPRLEPFVNSRVETSSAAECDRQGDLRVLASLRVRVCVAALALAASSRARDASGRLYVQLLRHVGVMLARASRPSLLRLVGTEQVCARMLRPWLLRRVGVVQVCEHVSRPWLLRRVGFVQVCAWVAVRRVGVMLASARVCVYAVAALSGVVQVCACLAASVAPSRGHRTGARARRFLCFVVKVRC